MVLCLGIAAFFIQRHLPSFLLREINNRLQRVPGHRGGVVDLQLDWKTPRLTLSRLRFNKLEDAPPGAHFSAEEISADLSWRQLLRGRFILNIKLEKPEITALMRQRLVGQPLQKGVWQPFFLRLPPFRIDKLVVHDARLRFRNDQAVPPINIYFDQVDGAATNLANRAYLVVPGTGTVVQGEGRLMDQSPMWIWVGVEPFAKSPSFVMRGEVKDFDMKFLNDTLRYYTGLEVRDGRLSMGGEITADGRAFKGRLHRRIEKLVIKNADPGLFKGMKAVFAQTWINWHVDKTTGRIDNEFELAGPMGYLEEDVFLAAVWAGRSAFIQSFRANLTDEVQLDLPETAQDEWAEQQAREREKAEKKKKSSDGKQPKPKK